MTTPTSEPASAPVQPEKSKIAVDRTVDSLTFHLPPNGLGGLAFFLLVVSVVENGISLVLLISNIVNLLRTGNLLYVALVILFSLTSLFGLFLIAATIQLVKRTCSLVAARDALIFTQTGPFRSGKKPWPISQIKSIRVAPSNFKVSKNILHQLQIRTVDNHYHGLLTGRPEPELHWIASSLIHFYNVPAAL